MFQSSNEASSSTCRQQKTKKHLQQDMHRCMTAINMNKTVISMS